MVEDAPIPMIIRDWDSDASLPWPWVMKPRFQSLALCVYYGETGNLASKFFFLMDEAYFLKESRSDTWNYALPWRLLPWAVGLWWRKGRMLEIELCWAQWLGCMRFFSHHGLYPCGIKFIYLIFFIL